MGVLRSFGVLFLLVGTMFGAVQPGMVGSQSADTAREPGLLFYLSGEHGFTADVSGGRSEPNYASDVKILPGGSKGSYFECGNEQLLSYWAPGNVYAQRGTVSFDWRPRDSVDETPFPVFRVGYGDHSSWDMVWMRIDYNGHGFDAFVTDINLGRTRVSYTMPHITDPKAWIHLALTWDETTGIRFYVNGKMVAEKAATGMFDATLDQFGPHSRLIAPTGVETSYNYDRGGDIDELRIYDRALTDENVATLGRDGAPKLMPEVSRTLDATGPDGAKDWQKEWWFHYGWNRPGEIPTPIETPYTTVRKVEVHDAYDLKRWWWRATDGIRETTWPGVYNRSRLPGRTDYFQLPDWDTYAMSGKSITFFMPEEKWNHLEIAGEAWGKMELMTNDAETHKDVDTVLFERPKGQERTINETERGPYGGDGAVTGGKLRFTNVEQETPIGEFAAYYVHPGREPSGIAQLRYRITGRVEPDNPTLTPLVKYIDGRFPADERMTMVALPAGAPMTRRTTAQKGLPIVHILVPADFREVVSDTRGPDGRLGHGFSYTWENMEGGLDGIAFDLPALKMKPTHGEYIPLNIQIKDPIWPMRDMLNFTFSVKPGEAHTLWLDTRDRILPNDKALWISIASASGEFNTSSLEGAQLRLIFKPYDEAKKEHVLDRFTQVRDNFANMVEENVTSKRLNTFVRFDADITDLLRIDPHNKLGRTYWYDVNKETARPTFVLPTPPSGIPNWAFLQVTDLGYLKRLVNWYVDNRQISDGEFGGGLSDDSDFTNFWPPAAMMGVDPEKLRASLGRELEAMYANGMFTNGLATGQYDELHSYEDGLNVLSQSMLLNFGSPKEVERAMMTAKRLEWLTGINEAGHRHIRSSFYSGTKMAEGGVWGWQKVNSWNVVQPALLLVLYNGTPETKKMMLELADGLLAHRKLDANGKYSIHTNVEFKTDKDLPGREPWYVLWAAYRWTGDKKYLQPFMDEGASTLRSINSNALDMMDVRDTWGKQIVASTQVGSPGAARDAAAGNEATEHLAWQMTGDKSYLEKLYASQIESAADRWFINTQGSLWIDRIYASAGELQRARLGGVELLRGAVYPGNTMSWRFDAPASAESVAILTPDATPEHMDVTLYNLDPNPVTAHMTGWEIEPGQWEITQGVEGAAGGKPGEAKTRTEAFERSTTLDFTLPPHATTVLKMKLVSKGTPYWSRPDLGIDAEDVKVTGRQMSVTVHSLGGVDAPAAKVVLRDAGGKVVASGSIGGLKAPLDLVPKTTVAHLTVPAGMDLKGSSVTVEMNDATPEVTQMNNRVELSGVPAGK